MIRAEGLTKAYGPLVAVDGIDLSVQPGQVYTLLGPNGAGKTTTVDMLVGLLAPDDGSATVLDAPAGERASARRIGVMPQDAQLHRGIKVSEALRLFASFYRRSEDLDDLADQLGLAALGARTVRQLSGGERRRLSLALAVVGRPDVLFCDEPTAEMDIEGRTGAWEIIGRARDRGAAVLVTTHMIEEAERVADRVGIMRRGRLVAEGSPVELTAAPSAGITITLEADIDVTDLSTRIGVPVERQRQHVYRAAAAATPELVQQIAAALADMAVLVRRIDTATRTLEDVYRDEVG